MNVWPVKTVMLQSQDVLLWGSALNWINS